VGMSVVWCRELQLVRDTRSLVPWIVRLSCVSPNYPVPLYLHFSYSTSTSYSPFSPSSPYLSPYLPFTLPLFAPSCPSPLRLLLLLLFPTPIIIPHSLRFSSCPLLLHLPLPLLLLTTSSSSTTSALTASISYRTLPVLFIADNQYHLIESLSLPFAPNGSPYIQTPSMRYYQ